MFVQIEAAYRKKLPENFNALVTARTMQRLRAELRAFAESKGLPL